MASGSTSERIVRNNPTSKSHVWKHFGFFTDEEGILLREKAVCRLCLSEVLYSKNTTNLRTHLERPHRDEYSLLLTAEGDKDKFLEQSQSTLLKVLEQSQPLPKDNERWRTLVEVDGNFIASDMQPSSVVENTGFKQLLHVAEPRFKVPSRPYFTNTVIPAMYTSKREKTERLLSSVQYCSVTTDIWPAQHSTRSYISLTVHCVASLWELASY